MQIRYNELERELERFKEHNEDLRHERDVLIASATDTDRLKERIKELEEQQANGPPKNFLQEKIANSLAQKVQELEKQLKAATHAAQTGQRFDNFDDFAY